MSGASRITLETVITETPARWAMSLRRTMLNAGPTPTEFAAEGVEKGAAGQMQQADAVTAAAHGDCVAGRERSGRLAIGAEDGFDALGKRCNHDGGVQADDHRAIGERVRANRGDCKHLRIRTDDRAARG